MWSIRKQWDSRYRCISGKRAVESTIRLDWNVSEVTEVLVSLTMPHNRVTWRRVDIQLKSNLFEIKSGNESNMAASSI